jgi:hypothetical protein
MPLVHNNITVGTTPICIATLPPGIQLTSVIVNNNDTSTIFIGDANITASAGLNQGLPVTTRVNQQVWLNAGDKLYAVSAAGTTTGAVTVLYSGI